MVWWRRELNKVSVACRSLNIECRELGEGVLKLSIEKFEAEGVDCVLTSGGVDSSFILLSSILAGRRPKAIVASYLNPSSSDLIYSKLVAEKLDVELHPVVYGDDDALKATEWIIENLETFDPVEVRNDVTIYIALLKAKELGCRTVATGDGGDELFAGYTFMLRMEAGELKEYVKNVVKFWRFPSTKVGSMMELKVMAPFTDPKIVSLALEAPHQCIVGVRGQGIYGKVALRLVLERYLGKEVAWRAKHPIELGSGSIKLSELWAKLAREGGLLSMSEGLRFKSEDAAFLYYIFKIKGLKVEKPKLGELECPTCSGGIEPRLRHCKYCGTYLGWNGKAASAINNSFIELI